MTLLALQPILDHLHDVGPQRPADLLQWILDCGASTMGAARDALATLSLLGVVDYEDGRWFAAKEGEETVLNLKRRVHDILKSRKRNGGGPTTSTDLARNFSQGGRSATASQVVEVLHLLREEGSAELVKEGDRAVGWVVR